MIEIGVYSIPIPIPSKHSLGVVAHRQPTGSSESAAQAFRNMQWLPERREDFATNAPLQ